MRRGLVGATFIVCLLAAGNVFAETVTESETNTTFQVTKNFGGIPHTLVGVGAREATALKINVYGAGMYVGSKAATKAWQGYMEGRFAKAGLVTDGNPDLAKIGRHATGRHFIVYGRVPRGRGMDFTRDVRADQVTGAYEESWERVRLDRAAAGDALTEFMAAVNHPVGDGQTMIIRTVGNRVFVNMPGQSAVRINANRALTVALWKVYFGNPPLQVPLRDGMLSMLRNVHALFAGQ